MEPNSQRWKKRQIFEKTMLSRAIIISTLICESTILLTKSVMTSTQPSGLNRNKKMHFFWLRENLTEHSYWNQAKQKCDYWPESYPATQLKGEWLPSFPTHAPLGAWLQISIPKCTTHCCGWTAKKTRYCGHNRVRISFTLKNLRFLSSSLLNQFPSQQNVPKAALFC